MHNINILVYCYFFSLKSHIIEVMNFDLRHAYAAIISGW